MKRRILLVDDEVAVLLTLKAVLEISGFDVHTAASAREARAKIKHGEYEMVITDMRMENDASGAEVVHAARVAPYHPAVALLTAFPVEEGDWSGGVAPDKVLIKATQTRMLLQQIEKLLAARAEKLSRLAAKASPSAGPAGAGELPGEGLSLAAEAGEDKPAARRRARSTAEKVGA